MTSAYDELNNPTLFGGLLAVQKEIPQFQKTAINPFFKSKYVPLEDVLPAVLGILHKHNFVLLQCPTIADGKPALKITLLHVSGESIENTMLLMSEHETPQGQGSAITYARRYSLMSLLGITADLDDDAEATRKAPARLEVIPAARTAQRPVAEQDLPLPTCPQGHGPMKYWPDSTSKAGKPVSAQYKCTNKGCKNDAGWPESIWADKWVAQVQLARGKAESYDPNDIPFDEGSDDPGSPRY